MMTTAVTHEHWDQEIDVLVAGSGIGGLGTAVIAAHHGARVAVVEKAAQLGGTTAKSAGYMWIPNNRCLRESGRHDPRPEALQYMARLARPRLYDPESPTLGLPSGSTRASPRSTTTRRKRPRPTRRSEPSSSATRPTSRTTTRTCPKTPPRSAAS